MIFEAICTCQLALFKGLAFGTHSRALHWRDDGPDSVTIFIEVLRLKGELLARLPHSPNLAAAQPPVAVEIAPGHTLQQRWCRMARGARRWRIS